MLYVLSTLALTCAALAALVGVVGVFKLHLLVSSTAKMNRPFVDSWRARSCWRLPLILGMRC